MRRRILPWRGWSASKLNLLNKCPLAFYFTYVLRMSVPEAIEKIFGQAIHWMAQHLFSLKKGLTSEEKFLGTWQHRWWKEMLEKKYKNRILIRKPSDPEMFYGRGRIILKKFYRDSLPYLTGELPKPEVEKYFRRIFKGHLIMGRIDRIQPKENGQVEIWDYKTGFRQPSQSETFRDRQFTFYNLNYLLQTGKNPEAMLILNLNTNQLIPVPIRTADHYRLLGLQLDEATIYVKNILNPVDPWKDFSFRWLNPEDIERKYFPSRPGRKCRYCQYEELCREYKFTEPMRYLWLEQELRKYDTARESQLVLELKYSEKKRRGKK